MDPLLLSAFRQVANRPRHRPVPLHGICLHRPAQGEAAQSSPAGQARGSELTTQGLIELGSIETSSHPFVQHVRRFLELDREAFVAKAKSFHAVEDIAEKLEDVEDSITWHGHVPYNYGFGYLSSSSKHDFDKEAFCAAVVAGALKTTGAQPLVVPIDKFYSYMTYNCSLVAKARFFADQEVIDRPAIVLSGFTQSAIYTEEVLRQIPHQYNIAESSDVFQAEFEKFAQGIHRFFKENVSVEQTLDWILKGHALEQQEGAQLLLAAALIWANQEAFQPLSYRKPTFLLLLQLHSIMQ